MSHEADCRKAYELINAFVLAREPRAQYVTREEILLVYKHFSPCLSCQIKPDMLSTMTGRLYAPIWEEHVKREMDYMPQQGDIVDVIPQS